VLDAIKKHWLAFMALILLLAFPVVLLGVFIVGKVSKTAGAKVADVVDQAAGANDPPAADPPAGS